MALANQNLRQIGPGVPELWSDKQTNTQTNKQTDRQTNREYNFIYIDTKISLITSILKSEHLLKF